jgi:hypothetical protein
VKRVLASLVGTGVVLVLTLMPSSPSTALDSGPRSPEPNVRQIDLRLGQGVSSITARRNGGGFVIGFAKCQVVVLDGNGVLIERYDLQGCKTLFTVRLGQLDGAEAIVASTYTGRTAVISGGEVKQYKVHDAAVTDSHLADGSLLTASDDGSVRLLPLASVGLPARVLTADVGVARVLLLDPVAEAEAPALFAGFDTGRIHAIAANGATVRTYESGVGRINALGLESDGRSLLVGGFDGRLRAIELASGRAADLMSAGSGINAMALDRAHGRVGVVSDDGSFILHDLNACAALMRMKLTDSPLTALAFDETDSMALVGDSAGLLHRITVSGPAAVEACGHDTTLPTAERP